MLEGRVEDEEGTLWSLWISYPTCSSGRRLRQLPFNRQNNPSASLRFLYNSSSYSQRVFPALPIQEETTNPILITFIRPRPLARELWAFDFPSYSITFFLRAHRVFDRTIRETSPHGSLFSNKHRNSSVLIAASLSPRWRGCFERAIRHKRFRRMVPLLLPMFCSYTWLRTPLFAQQLIRMEIVCHRSKWDDKPCPLQSCFVLS